MKIVSGYFVYKLYVTYKAHFNQNSMDISKYNFNTFNIPYSTFINAKGKHFYDKIATRLKKRDVISNLFISAFIDDPSVWIGEISDNLSHYIDLSLDRERRLKNISYIFQKDCIQLIEEGMQFDDKTKELVLDAFINSNIELETFIILKRVFNFKFDNNNKYDYFYKGKYEKYEFLININTDKYKKLLEEIIMKVLA